MCAGVQNVSRPIVMCHEMSQISPRMMLVAANTVATSGQGSDSARASARADGGASAAGMERASMVERAEDGSRASRSAAGTHTTRAASR